MVDPLAEKYYNLSSYNFCANNPIVYTDFTGMLIDNYGIDDEGNVELLEKTPLPHESLVWCSKYLPTLLNRAILDTADNIVRKIDYRGDLLMENDTLKYIFTSEGYAKQEK